MPTAAPLYLQQRHGLALLFHCGLPVAVGWSFATVITKASDTPSTMFGMIILLGGIASAYIADRMIDSSSDLPDRSMTKWGEAIGTVIVGFLSLGLYAALHIKVSLPISALILGLIVLTYTELKRIPFAKTAILALAWVWACGTLPFAEAVIQPRWWALDVTIPLLLLVAGNGILCDLKDRHSDCNDSIATFPSRFGPERACQVVTGILFLCVALSAAQGHLELALSGAALALAAQYPGFMESEISGPLIADGILILPGILINLGVS